MSTMLEEISVQLIASYKPRSMPGKCCALCSATEHPMSMHIIEFYHDAAIPTPPAFVPMSESHGTRRGAVPVCIDCAPVCSWCGLPVLTSWIKKMRDLLQDTTPGVSLRLGNGHCRHVHPILNLLSWTKPVHLAKEKSLRGIEESKRRGATTAVKGAHLPGHLVPPPGHNLKATIASADMYAAIEASRDSADKAVILITRCFDNALHCDALEWDLSSAKDSVTRVFSGQVEQEALGELQLIAGEAVRLGYRTATSLDLEVIMGMKPDNSWRPELEALLARARNCVVPPVSH